MCILLCLQVFIFYIFCHTICIQLYMLIVSVLKKSDQLIIYISRYLLQIQLYYSLLLHLYQQIIYVCLYHYMYRINFKPSILLCNRFVCCIHIFILVSILSLFRIDYVKCINQIVQQYELYICIMYYVYIYNSQILQLQMYV